MTREQRLLVCLAHPDDEILSPGGTIALLAERGVHVVLVCATRGEAGEIARPELATPETLGAVREQELYCAAQRLGIAEVIFLGYRDSGMAGSPDNEHPDAFTNAPAAVVVPQLVEIIRRLQPQVVLTFEPYGGYGHPDHQAINRHTVAAFDVAGKADQYPTAGEPWMPQRLVYTILPHFFFEEMITLIQEQGDDVSDFDLTERRENGWSDDDIHFFIDVTNQVEAKEAAWNCHATQFGPNSRFRRLPRDKMMRLLSREHFALVRPEPQPGIVFHDLFAGLQVTRG